MRYVSLDIETTGLDPTYCQVLQLAMVVEDTSQAVPLEKLPYINLRFRHNRLQGEPFAMLHMNYNLLCECERRGFSPEVAWATAEAWLSKHFGPKERVVVAGKNVGVFDFQFLPATLRRRLHHRTIDPGSLFIRWNERVPPSLDDLLEAVGGVKHDALADARDVIRVLRRDYTEIQIAEEAEEVTR